MRPSFLFPPFLLAYPGIAKSDEACRTFPDVLRKEISVSLHESKVLHSETRSRCADVVAPTAVFPFASEPKAQCFMSSPFFHSSVPGRPGQTLPRSQGLRPTG